MKSFRRLKLKEPHDEKNDVSLRYLRNRGQRNGGRRYARIGGDEDRHVDVADNKD